MYVKTRMNILGYVYILHKKSTNIITIGSSMNFLQKLSSYRSLNNFNNRTYSIWNFDIINSNLNCYEIEREIKRIALSYYSPYVHHDTTDGLEYYDFTDEYDLCKFLKLINVEYIMTQINIDELMSFNDITAMMNVIVI